MSRHATAGFTLPPAATAWLTSPSPARVLTLSGHGLALVLRRAGHEVFAIDKSASVVATLVSSGIDAVAAQAESLPFDPCLFDVVAAHQVFHRYAPGLVLSEMARVLRPGGHVAISYLVRDDSVPWVKRLVSHVQQIDPSAMTGGYGHHSVSELVTSKYFPRHEQRNFRHWVPISRDELVQLATRLPAYAGLEASEQQDFLGGIRSLYDDAAPGADDLRLPYQLSCWKAFVDHQELTAPIDVADEALVIPL